LALAFAPMRVNTLAPGLLDTPLSAGMDAEKRHAILHRAEREIPLHRVGQADDVAQAMLLAMSNPSITGTTIVVDGGTSIA
jgi:NAD(P)-dependent dehydrogenase (short-subunit alcohol dehydrogenase family)